MYARRKEGRKECKNGSRSKQPQEQQRLSPALPRPPKITATRECIEGSLQRQIMQPFFNQKLLFFTKKSTNCSNEWVEHSKASINHQKSKLSTQ